MAEKAGLRVVGWDWSNPARQRRLSTVEDHIFWTYSVLNATRSLMDGFRSDGSSPCSQDRSKAADHIMSLFRNGVKEIPNLACAEAAAGLVICAHCGSTDGSRTDHLIPMSRIKEELAPWNQVASCSRCISGRGNKDLMAWHRQQKTFPGLGVLGRYLTLCYLHAQKQKCLHDPVDLAVTNSLPFDPRNLPLEFPPMDQLVWDWGED